MIRVTYTTDSSLTSTQDLSYFTRRQFNNTILTFTPGLNLLSSGWVIIICAVAASALAALRYPVAKEAQT